MSTSASASTSRSEAEDIRGFTRRFLVYHVIGWSIMTVVLVTVFASRADWSRSWVLALALSPSALLLPNFVKFRRFARQAGYSRQKTLATYLRGVSAADIEQIIRARQEREAAWEHLLNQVVEFDPQLADRIGELRGRNNLEGAVAVFERAQSDRARLEQQYQARLDGLRTQAARFHCSAIVEPLLVGGNVKEAEAVVLESRHLLEQARHFGVFSEVVELLSSLTQPDLNSIASRLKQARDSRSLTKLKDELEQRIAAAPRHDQPGLHGRLEALLHLPFDSRDFRKALHGLERELAHATGARK